MLTIGETQLNEIIGFSSDIIADLMPVILLIGGVILAMYILESLLNRNKEKE